MTAEPLSRRFVAALSSMRLTQWCLGLLMAVVVACTVLQVPLGTHMAVERTIRSFFIWWTPAGSGLRVPVFPGGGLVGLLLLVNLALAQFMRLERSRRKAGVWVAHLGLALLFVGEFSTALFQVESEMPIEVGQTRDYSEDGRRVELALADVTDPAKDTVTSIPDSRLTPGAALEHASLPFRVTVEKRFANAAPAGDGSYEERPVAAAEGEGNAPAVLVSLSSGGRELGRFWAAAGGASPAFQDAGRTWRLSLRPRRYYLPFSVTLKEFKHDVYPGTDIPKNFSSLVRLKDAATGEDRDALIYMNHPLRYGGKAFYQASFGKGDTLSIFQVVRNPGWLIPYLSCVLVALGLTLHLGAKLSASLRSAR